LSHGRTDRVKVGTGKNTKPQGNETSGLQDFSGIEVDDYFTAFFRAMLALNRGTRAAGILIGFPV